MCGFFTEYFCMFMVVRWDNLVPGANSLVGSLFCELLCHSSLCDAEVQFISICEEGLVSDRGSHSGDPDGEHWFPRCYSFGVDDEGGREHASCPVRVSIRRCEPQVSKDEVVRSHVSDIEAKEVRSFSRDDFEFGVVFQTPSCVRGSVGVLEFSGVFH